MKTVDTSFRWVLLLVLTASLVSGCRIWDPKTWRIRPRPAQVERWKYETATPYAALGSRVQPADRIIAVSGMGYDSSVAFVTADGRRVIAESAPVGGGQSVRPVGENSWAGPDSQGRQERSAESWARSNDWQTESAAPGVAAAPDAFSNLLVGIPVPGKAGFVNLPDPYSGLPQIDVRGIASGTPVEVPNPLQPGERVRFRVP